MGTIVTQSNPLYNQLEIVKTGSLTVSLTAPSTQQTSSVSHGLGFVPMIIAFIDSGGGLIYNQTPLTLFGTTAGMITYDMYVDSNDITGRISKETNDSNNNEVTFKYYLLRDRAN